MYKNYREKKNTQKNLNTSKSSIKPLAQRPDFTLNFNDPDRFKLSQAEIVKSSLFFPFFQILPLIN